MARAAGRQLAKRAMQRVVAAVGDGRLSSAALVQLNVRTHRTWALPILFYAPTSRCNSRCVSCDWWRTDGSSDLRREEVAALCRELPGLRTRLVVFTGGEPLVREDVFDLADLFRAQGATLHLLTSGLALERHAEAVVERFAAVTISLDGHTRDLYRRIRGVDGLEAVERGVRRIKHLRPGLPVRARSTLHRKNFRALPDLIEKATAMGLDQISFLAADVGSDAFGRSANESAQNRRLGSDPTKSSGVAASPHGLLLDPDEVDEFETVVWKAVVSHAQAFEQRRVAERPERLQRLVRYYRAKQNQGAFPEVRCNAPWASAVVESDGTVRPCFFHRGLGNIREKSLRSLLDDEMVNFRRGLNMANDPTCQRCVCSLRVGMRSQLW